MFKQEINFAAMHSSNALHAASLLFYTEMTNLIEHYYVNREKRNKKQSEKYRECNF